MAKSVKLTDGSYIDAEGVYDATQGKTQSALNSSFIPGNWFGKGRYLYTCSGYSTNVNGTSIVITFSYQYSGLMGILISRYGVQFVNVYTGSNPSQITKCDLTTQYTVKNAEMPTISYTEGTCTIKVPVYVPWALIYTPTDPPNRVSVTST